MADVEYRAIIDHIRGTLLACDKDCENCKDIKACVSDMKEAVYEVIAMVEQLYTFMAMVSQPCIDAEMKHERKMIDPMRVI